LTSTIKKTDLGVALIVVTKKTPLLSEPLRVSLIYRYRVTIHEDPPWLPITAASSPYDDQGDSKSAIPSRALSRKSPITLHPQPALAQRIFPSLTLLIALTPPRITGDIAISNRAR